MKKSDIFLKFLLTFNKTSVIIKMTQEERSDTNER